MNQLPQLSLDPPSREGSNPRPSLAGFLTREGGSLVGDIFDSLSPDPIGAILGTGFLRFSSTLYKMNGLVKIKGDALEILAVVSDKPGRGNFRKFISACKERFRQIHVWHIGNALVENALARYGFSATQKFEQGEQIPGMIWEA